MDKDLLLFISNYILKNGEQLDLKQEEIYVSANIVDIAILRQTARTYRKVGRLTLFVDTNYSNQEIPDPSLLKWTVNKRTIMQDESKAFDWLSQGWIIKEMRFKQDEKTIERIVYRMGYRLFNYQQRKVVDDRRQLLEQLQEFQVQANALVNVLASVGLNDRIIHLASLIYRMVQVNQYTLDELSLSDWFERSWGDEKRLRYLFFLIAFLEISANQNYFDWKEIGAKYYAEIGGSKAFDTNKDEFINLLEDWAGKPISVLGMVSLGKITPLFFAGQLEGKWSSFKPGPVHALTDLSITDGSYATNSKNLWLVENRAILTRIAAEKSFVGGTESLIICVDGHLRSSHKQCIKDVITNSQIQQVLIWSDYDEAGLWIAHELAACISSFNLNTKWICHDHQVVRSWTMYKQYMDDLLAKKQAEQEQVLGGAEDWERWINL